MCQKTITYLNAAVFMSANTKYALICLSVCILVGSGVSAMRNTLLVTTVCGHGLGGALKHACPLCHSRAYVIKRVTRVIRSSLKKLKMRKEKPFLHYLGARDWTQVCEHIEKKMQVWNTLHPHVQMSLTNMQLDHIRPVHAFKTDRLRGIQTTPVAFMNHFTNLQPMLMQDNSWKGSVWAQEDQVVWIDKIILNDTYCSIYYPKDRVQPSLMKVLTNQTDKFKL
jgi:hypothetical protein